MKTAPRIQVFSSSTPAYHQAFQTFLDHTDQKTKAREQLDVLVGQLPAKRTFIDAGAGNGKVTAWFTDAFERTIAAEPNDSLRQELAQVCPRAEVLEHTILDAPITAKGDFILSSHVFYYIDDNAWMENLERLASWLAPQGLLVVIIQNHESDCMRMLRHFLKRSFNLNDVAQRFKTKHPGRYQVHMRTVPSQIAAPDLETAFRVAEFMLNLLPLQDPPSSEDVRAYVASQFAAAGGGYRFSCTQDFLEIHPT